MSSRSRPSPPQYLRGHSETSFQVAAIKTAPKTHPRLVVLRTEDGRYVGRRGGETILVREKRRAVVWDWDKDRVAASIAAVRRDFGQHWTAVSSAD